MRIALKTNLPKISQKLKKPSLDFDEEKVDQEVSFGSASKPEEEVVRNNVIDSRQSSARKYESLASRIGRKRK